MVAVGKKTIVVDTKINPYGETKTKKAPDWFAARPEVAKAIQEIAVKRSMQLDPRKWKKKTLEDGVYAVARYELAFFATALSTIEKKIIKALPKDQKKKKFTKDTKNESKEETDALDKAATEVKKLFKKISKAIEDKVSLALDDVESDKGDNKASLRAGKEALKQFNNLDTGSMFSKPTESVVKLLNTLGDSLKKSGDEDDGAFKTATSSLEACKKEFDATAKKAQNVVKYLLHKGEKISKDTKSDPAMQAVGKLIIGPKVKPDLEKLSSNVDGYDKQLGEVAKFLKEAKANGDVVKNRAREFSKNNKSKDADLRDAVKSVKNVGEQFNKVVKEVKS